MPIHAKVKAGTAAAAASGIVVWLLGRYVLHGSADPVVAAEVYAAVPAVLTFAAGYLTPASPPAVPVRGAPQFCVNCGRDASRCLCPVPALTAPPQGAADEKMGPSAV